MPSLVRLEIDDGIAFLTLERAEKRNALSPELINDVAAALTEVERDPVIRVMILAGAGRTFCAGMDLHGVLDDPGAMAEMLRGLSSVMRRIRRLMIPTIARVQGAAVGGGCGLMVVTDFALTHAESKVGYPEVDLGVCPAVVAPWLIRKIGAGRARAMLLAGGTMTGQAGYEIGLATHLVEESRLEASALELARSLARGGREALAVTKQWLNELDSSMDDGPLDQAATLSAEVIAGAEAQSRLRQILSS